MKTLIVEDDFTSRLLLQEMLRPHGPVHIAVNGKEAVEAVRMALASNQRYDLVCLDIMLPEMDGQSVLKVMRAMEEEHGILSTHGAKVVMTTALKDPKNVFIAYNALCDAYLPKPISKSALLKCLRDLHLVT